MKSARMWLLFKGKQGVNWIHLVLDRTEWRDPRYYHQN